MRAERANHLEIAMKQLFLSGVFSLGCAALIAGCAPAQVQTANKDEETKVKDERCFATGSNLPRRDCRDVIKVDPSRVEMPEVRSPRSGGVGN
jgi:hypothetical protein